jgi:hypothetical protein
VLLGALSPEEVHLGPKGEHEEVVGEWVETLEPDLPRLEVDLVDRRLVDGGVVLVLDEIAERMPDRCRLQQARRQLIEQRLEGVVVVPVDEHDVDVRLLQLLGGADAGEPSADDQHSWPCVRRLRSPPSPPVMQARGRSGA